MKTKIKKALDSAINNLLTNDNWLTSVLKRSDVEIHAFFKNEQEVNEIINNIQPYVKSFTDPHMEPSCYYTIYNRCAEPGSFVLKFEYYTNGWLDYEWYFFGDRENGIKRICRVDPVNDCLIFMIYPLQLKTEIDEVYQFASDVLQAFTIEPHLFEVFYDFQVVFFGNDKDILYDVEYLAEYERVDV